MILPDSHHIPFTIEQYENILEEIEAIFMSTTLDLILDVVPTALNFYRLNQRLEIIGGTMQYRHSEELSAWLRYTFKWKENLPAWQPLLIATRAIMLDRHHQQVVDGDLLHGLLPHNKG